MSSKVCWGCVALAIYDRDKCHTIARHTGKFSPHLKVKLEFTLVLLNPELTHVLLNPFLKTLDLDQLVSLRSHLIRINTVSHLLKIQVSAEQDKISQPKRMLCSSQGGDTIKENLKNNSILFNEYYNKAKFFNESE